MLKLLFGMIFVDASLCHGEKYRVQTLRAFVVFANTLTREKPVLEKMARLLLICQAPY